MTFTVGMWRAYPFHFLCCYFVLFFCGLTLPLPPLSWTVRYLPLPLKYLCGFFFYILVWFGSTLVNQLSPISVWITKILICGILTYLTASLVHSCSTMFVKSHQNLFLLFRINAYLYMYVDEEIKKNANVGVLSSTKWTRHSFCNKKEYSLTILKYPWPVYRMKYIYLLPAWLGVIACMRFVYLNKTKMT